MRHRPKRDSSEVHIKAGSDHPDPPDGQLFTNVRQFQVKKLGFPIAVDLGDLDGDNDLDLVVSNYAASSFSVYQNNGDGLFGLASILDAPESGSCAILQDRDKDGDLDITGIDEIEDVLLLFQNGLPSSVSEVHSPNANQPVISPNPFNQEIMIDWKKYKATEYQLLIYNLDGSLVWSGRLSESEVSISIPKGLYFYQLLNGKNTFSGKMVKQ